MFRNLKIGTRLGIGFTAIVAIVLLLATIAYSRIVDINNKIVLITTEQMPNAELANYIIDHANEATIATRDAILSKDPAQVKRELEAITHASAEVSTFLEKLEPAIKDEKGKQLLADFKQKRAPYAEALKAIIAQVNEGKKDAAINELNTKMNPAKGPYFDAINKIVAHETALMAQSGKDAENLATATKQQVLILAVIAILLAVATGVLITLSITRPVVGLVGVMEKVSAGNLDFKLETQSKDEIGVLSRAVDQVRVNLNALVSDTSLLAQAAVEGRLETRADAGKHQGDFRKIVEGVNNTLDAVIGPVNEVKRVMTAMEAGDLTQSINQNYQGDFAVLQDAVNNSLSKLSSTVGEVSQAASGLNIAAEQVSSTAQTLSQASSEQAASLEETTAAIEEMSSSIAQNTDNAKVTDSMATQSASDAIKGGEAVKATVIAMKSIADKISIIDDIAYRTDLLALNAAIEAARAGEHGKGFAVVAAEVRKLAERSQVAAQEIGELASSSVQTAENAGSLLETIVPSIRKTADLVREISGASMEQSAGASQINQAMEQLNMATQSNAASSEELSATADEMTSQAMRLRDLMGQFVTEHASAQSISGRESAIVVKPKKSKVQIRQAESSARLYADDPSGTFGPIN